MSKSSLFALILGISLGLGVTAPPVATAAAFGCDDDSGVCIDSGDATWSADRQSTSKDRKKRSTSNGGSLSVSLDGGRGSVFLNGRFVGTAPISRVAIPSGKNDLQVRDGATVLANGLLTVPKGADVSITVHHD